MRKTGCGCSPVLKLKESGTVIGVVTERDVCQKLVADDLKASETAVERIMSPASACCGKDDALDEVRRKLYQHKATSLPVVDKVGSCCSTISIHHC